MTTTDTLTTLPPVRLLRPYIPTRKPLPDLWWHRPNATIKRLLDNPDREYRVYYAPTLLALTRDLSSINVKGESSAALVQHALTRAHVATIHVKYPKDGAGKLTVLVRRWVEGGDTVAYYASASGYGYDKLAAALDGIPLYLPEKMNLVTGGYEGDRPPVILTNHCGLSNVDHPWPEDFYWVGHDHLPPDYFTL